MLLKSSFKSRIIAWFISNSSFVKSVSKSFVEPTSRSALAINSSHVGTTIILLEDSLLIFCKLLRGIPKSLNNSSLSDILASIPHISGLLIKLSSLD